MENQFFEKPVLNSPYGYPDCHWELDEQGQPTQKIIGKRRPAKYITPIPKPKKRKGKVTDKQQPLVLDEGSGISTQEQIYDPSPLINAVRREVDLWRAIPDSKDWKVTPETVRLLKHWRHHKFSNLRPFFCQVEAVETLIWLTEVAPKYPRHRGFLTHLESANREANPELRMTACDSVKLNQQVIRPFQGIVLFRKTGQISGILRR
ncbi:MAG: hypothetical protein B6245_16390 [Desulfobacteraceae bacterium 4572_88]|nr:MAG: hypothetical protein B6245_16390 [Desulfobacteraceae bacterium 4572_88]